MKEIVKRIFHWLGCVVFVVIPVLVVWGVWALFNYVLPGNPISVWEAILFTAGFTISFIFYIAIIAIAYDKAKQKAESKIGTIILTILYTIAILVILYSICELYDMLFPNHEEFEPYRL